MIINKSFGLKRCLKICKKYTIQIHIFSKAHLLFYGPTFTQMEPKLYICHKYNNNKKSNVAVRSTLQAVDSIRSGCTAGEYMQHSNAKKSVIFGLPGLKWSNSCPFLHDSRIISKSNCHNNANVASCVYLPYILFC